MKTEHKQITHGQLSLLTVWVSKCGGQVDVKGKIHRIAEVRLLFFSKHVRQLNQ